jgi:hypothetical protein
MLVTSEARPPFEEAETLVVDQDPFVVSLSPTTVLEESSTDTTPTTISPLFTVAAVTEAVVATVVVVSATPEERKFSLTPEIYRA